MSEPSLADLAGRSATHGAVRLDQAALRDVITVLSGWQARNDAIEKTFRFAGYPETIQFVNAVAWIAQRLDHHPDLEVGYDRCRVVWTTHDANGVTMNDCIAAAKIEQLFQ